MIEKILINSLSGYARLFINLLILFFITPFIISYLGKDTYGMWSFAFSIVSAFELLDFGFAVTSIKYITESITRGDKKSSKAFTSTIFFSYLFIATIGTIIITLLLFGKIFQEYLDENTKNIFIYVLLILLFRLLWIQLPSSVFKGILTSKHYLFLVSFGGVLNQVTYLILTILTLKMGYGLVSLAINYTISALLEAVFLYLISVFFVSEISISWKYAKFNYLKKVSSFNTAQIVSNFSGFVLFNSDLIIIKLFYPYDMIAIYAVALRVTVFCLMLIKQVPAAMTPTILHYYALKKWENIRRLYIYGTRLIWSLATMITIGGCISSDQFFILWLGKPFEFSSVIFIILLINFWLTIPIILAGDILQLCGYHHFCLFSSLTGSLVHIMVSFLFASPFGLVGVAFGNILGTVIGLILVVNKLFIVYGLVWSEFFKRSFHALFFPALSQALVLGFFSLVYKPENILMLIIINLVAAGVYAVIFWIFSIKKEEKQILMQHLRIRK